MLEVGYGDVEEVLQFPCDTEELDDLLGLLAEVFVDLERCLCVNMGHLEVVLENIDDALVACLKQDQEILHQHPQRGDVEFVLEVVEVELGANV